MSKPFLSYFSGMKDHRINRKKLHPLENIIAITIAAIICNMETWEEVALFGEDRKSFFSKFLDLKNGIPSKDTFRRFFAALDPKVFETHFNEWAKSITKNIDREFVSIDGKTERLASKMSENSFIHLVSAWASNNRIVLGQVKTDEKSNEITAIPELLDTLFLKGSIVTIDAMGCQKNIAKKIVDKEADYILAVKENHPTLYEDIRRSFEKKRCQETLETFDYGHGRIEERKYSIIKDLNFIHDIESWQNLNSIARVDSRRTDKKTGEIQEHTRYYICSITQLKQISEGVRNHWGIENQLHWCLDVGYGADSSSKRAGFSSQNFSMVSKITLNLIRMNSENDEKRFKNKVGIKTKRKFAALRDDYLLELLRSF